MQGKRGGGASSGRAGRPTTHSAGVLGFLLLRTLLDSRIFAKHSGSRLSGRSLSLAPKQGGDTGGIEVRRGQRISGTEEPAGAGRPTLFSGHRLRRLWFWSPYPYKPWTNTRYFGTHFLIAPREAILSKELRFVLCCFGLSCFCKT